MRSATAHNVNPASDHAWANASGRSFFAWRMAAACKDALLEVEHAMAVQRDPERTRALREADSLLRRELRRWVRKGEELDDIVSHLPHLCD